MKEALCLALWALDSVLANHKGAPVLPWIEARDAVKAALEAKDEPVAWGVFEGNLHDMFFSQEEAQEMAELKGTHAEVRPLYATPPQPEQEQKPMHPEMRKMWEDHFDKCFAESTPQPEQEPVAFASHGVVNWIADKQFQHEAHLYSAPQRTWVGLTDVEIVDIMDAELTTQNTEHFALCQAIEAKLKEKNERTI